MTEEADRQAYQEASDKQFRALGVFVQEFELIIEWIRIACMFILSRDGQQQQLVDIVLHHSSLTAKPLFEIMRALFAKITEGVDPSEIAVLNSVMSQIAKDFDSLVEARNSLLHGTWRIGWQHFNEDDFSKLNLSKRKVTKHGLVDAKVPFNLGELEALSIRCDEVKRMIVTLNSCQVGRHSFSGNFVKTGDRWTHTGTVKA